MRKLKLKSYNRSILTIRFHGAWGYVIYKNKRCNFTATLENLKDVAWINNTPENCIQRSL